LTESITKNQLHFNFSEKDINKKLYFLNENKEMIKNEFLKPILGRKQEFSESFFSDLFLETEKIIVQMVENGNKKNKYLRIDLTVAAALYIACRKLTCCKSQRFISNIFNKSQSSIGRYLKNYRSV